jgi:hypothetical protein
VAEEVTGQPAPQEPMDVETHAATIARGLLESEEATPAKVEKPRDEKGKFTKETPEAPVEAEQPAEEAPAEEASAEETEEPEVDWEKLKALKRKIRVKNEAGEDEEAELTLEEMEKGVMLERDYRAKTARIAREREAVQAKIREAIEPKLKEYDEKLQIAEKAIWDTLMPEIQTINWNQLAKDNPAEWAQKYQYVQNVNAKLAQIQSERQRIAAEREIEIKAKMKKEAEEAVDILKTEIPGWSNDKYGQILKTGIEKYGFKAEEVNAITDPRAIKVLHDAMQYQALKAKPIGEKRVAPQAPKVVKPGAGEKPDANANKWTEGMARLQKTGKPQDAVEVAKLLLARENRR